MSKPKSYVGIKSEVEGSVLELHFTDHIYDGFDWETWEQKNMVQETIDKVKAANPSTIKIIINSLGGDVMIGLALYNFLKSHKAEKEVEIIGFAASIASVLAMCASPGKLSMAKNSFMIIHAAWTYAAGNAKDMREQAETLDKVSNEMADIYAQRSGKEASFFTDLWADGDYWMTGTEAKAFGLVDELLNTAAVNASADLAGFGFRNVPTQLINASINPKKTFMANRFPTIAAALGHEQMEHTEEGIFLQSEEAATIEAALSNAATSATALSAANDTITEHVATIGTLQAAATTAQETAAAQTARITALEAQVAELGSQASGSGTVLATEEDEVVTSGAAPSYASDENPVNAWADRKLRNYKK